MLNRTNVCKFAYICLNFVIMLNRNDKNTKPKVDVEAIKNDREKIVKSNEIVKK